MSDPKEQELMQAAVALGEATQKSSEKERDVIRKLYDDVKTFAEQQKEKGVFIDRSAFFAAGIIFHPEIENQEVIDAAVNYVNLDYLFVKGREGEETPANA